MNKMIHTHPNLILEFNGLPGLGKTTVAEALLNELKNSGYDVEDWKKKYCWLQKKHSPLPELYNLGLYHLVAKYAKLIPPINQKRKHLNWTNFYVWKYKTIEKYSVADFTIIDEGIIQFFVSIAHPNVMPHIDLAEEVVRKIKRMGVSFVRIDCVNHVDEAATRVLSRPSRGLAFEKMNQNDLHDSMNNWAINLNYVRSLFSRVFDNQTVVTIDTKECIEKNVQIIKNSICNE